MHLALILPLALPHPPFAQDGGTARAAPGVAPISHLTLRVGSRTWSEDILDDVFDSQTSFAVLWDSRKTPSGFGFEIGAFFSADDASESDGVLTASIDQSLFELMVGGRYTQQLGTSQAFVYGSAGLDLAYSSVEAEISDGVTTLSEDDSDTSVGAYLGAGGYFMFSRRVGLGVDVRRTLGTEDDNLDVDIDYTELAVSVLVGL